MAGYVLTFQPNSLTHLEHDIWKLRVTFTAHQDIHGDEDDNIEIGHSDITIVDVRNFDVISFTISKGDYICGECTDLFIYYLKNNKLNGVFPNGIVTFIEKFYIFPEHRNNTHGSQLLKLLTESLSQLSFNDYFVLSPYPVFDEAHGDRNIEMGTFEYKLLKEKIENLYLKHHFELYRGISDYDIPYSNTKRTKQVLDTMIHTIGPTTRDRLFLKKLSGIGYSFEPFAAFIYDDTYKVPGFVFT